jgi:hypothetical protein
MDRLHPTTNEIESTLRGEELYHARHVRYYVKVLRPDASDALLIAATGHDIGKGMFSPYGSDVAVRRSRAGVDGRIVAGIMRKHGYLDSEPERAEWLIANHEDGQSHGDPDLEALQAADLFDAAIFKIPKRHGSDCAEARERVLGRIPKQVLKKLEPYIDSPWKCPEEQ